MIINSLTDMNRLGEFLADKLKPGMVVLLNGQLGAGKTTLTQSIGKALGISRAIKSPTYTIIKEYSTDFGKLIHMDAYRLNEGGADSIDFDMYLTDENILLIEWGQYLKTFLPSDYLKINIERTEFEEERLVFFEVIGHNNTYKEIMKEIEGFESE